jgi:Ion channel
MIHSKIWESFSRFWATDRGLSIFLLMIVVVVFVLPSLADLGIARRLFFDIFFSLLLISGIASMSGRRRVFITLTGISIVALAVRWIDSFNASALLDVLNYFATITAIILFSTVVLSQVLKKGPITVHRIEGAIAVYLLLGLAWAHTYELIEYMSPGAFAGAITDSGRFSSWTYFSFVTLATLGYGDISPLHPAARSLAVAEAITGQLYLAILIARLVSQELYYRTTKGQDISDEFKE